MVVDKMDCIVAFYELKNKYEVCVIVRDVDHLGFWRGSKIVGVRFLGLS
jgi:hypothetical protein